MRDITWPMGCDRPECRHDSAVPQVTLTGLVAGWAVVEAGDTGAVLERQWVAIAIGRAYVIEPVLECGAVDPYAQAVGVVCEGASVFGVGRGFGWAGQVGFGVAVGWGAGVAGLGQVCAAGVVRQRGVWAGDAGEQAGLDWVAFWIVAVAPSIVRRVGRMALGSIGVALAVGADGTGVAAGVG